MLGTTIRNFNWRIIGVSALHKGGILHNADSFDVACRHFRCGERHFEVSFHRLLFFFFFFFFFAKKIFAICVSVCLVVSECWLLVGAGLYLE